MDNELLDLVRIANREFQEFIGQVTLKGAKALESPGGVRRLEKIHLRLAQISQHLATLSKSPPRKAEAAYAVLKYRETLKTLGAVLETLHFSLLAEKSRLEQVRGNLQAASAWAKSLREIS
jgi:hypothetical protein